MPQVILNNMLVLPIFDKTSLKFLLNRYIEHQRLLPNILTKTDERAAYLNNPTSLEKKEAYKVAAFYTNASDYINEEINHHQWKEKISPDNPIFHHWVMFWPLHGEFAHYPSNAFSLLKSHLEMSEKKVQSLLKKIFWQRLRFFFRKDLDEILSSLQKKLREELQHIQSQQQAILYAMAARLDISHRMQDESFDDVIAYTYNIAAQVNIITLRETTLPKQYRHGLTEDLFHFFLNTLQKHSNANIKKRLQFLNHKDDCIPMSYTHKTLYPIPHSLLSWASSSRIQAISYDVRRINYLFKKSNENNEPFFIQDSVTKKYYFISPFTHPAWEQLQACENTLQKLPEKAIAQKPNWTERLFFWRHRRLVKQLNRITNHVKTKKLIDSYFYFGVKLKINLLKALEDDHPFTKKDETAVEQWLEQCHDKMKGSHLHKPFSELTQDIYETLKQLREQHNQRENKSIYQKGLKAFQMGQFEKALFYMRTSQLFCVNATAKIHEILLTNQLAYENGNNEIISLEQHHRDAWINRVNRLIQQKKLMQALACIQQLHRLEPKNSNYLKRCFVLEKQLKQFDRCLITLTTLQSIKPNDVDLQHARVHCLFQLCSQWHLPSEKLHSYVDELNIHLEEPCYHIYLPQALATQGYLHFQAKQYKQAIALFTQALQEKQRQQEARKETIPFTNESELVQRLAEAKHIFLMEQNNKKSSRYLLYPFKKKPKQENEIEQVTTTKKIVQSVLN